MSHLPERSIKSFAISWERFHQDTKILAGQLSKLKTYRGLIAVTRGGLVPAAIIAREIGIRHIDTLCISSYDDQHQRELNVIKSVEGDGQGWLIVDDLVDSGRTAELIRNMYPKAYFAVVYAKPQGKRLVDHFVLEVDQDTWIDFPWDLDSNLEFVQPMVERG